MQPERQKYVFGYFCGYLAQTESSEQTNKEKSNILATLEDAISQHPDWIWYWNPHRDTIRVRPRNGPDRHRVVMEFFRREGMDDSMMLRVLRKWFVEQAAKKAGQGLAEKK